MYIYLMFNAVSWLLTRGHGQSKDRQRESNGTSFSRSKLNKIYKIISLKI